MSTADGIPPISKARSAELDARSKALHTGIPIAEVIADLKRRAEQLMREATPERRAELDRRAATPENSFSVEEVLGDDE